MNKLNKTINIIDKNLRRLQHLQNKSFIIDESVLQETINYLSSDEAFKSLEKDPYWPKWDTPWWRITLLYELELTHLIPTKIITKMTEQINTHYLKFFPFVEEDIPEGIDPISQIMCHCALGTMYQILDKLNHSKSISWAREWFIKYQIDDGGMNCDEVSYTKDIPKSSLVSSLPPLEAILNIKNINQKEEEFLDKGAEYLISKKIFKNSKNEVISKEWLSPFFPRFYEYDILRAISFLTKWAVKRSKELPVDSIIEPLTLLDNKISNDNYFITSKPYFLDVNTRYKDENSNWQSKKADSFPLLDYVISSNIGTKYLTKQWYETIKNLKALHDKSLLV